MNYDEITKITAERISDYMTEAVNTDSQAVAEMFHNAAWGVRTLWFELVTKIDIDIHNSPKNGKPALSPRHGWLKTGSLLQNMPLRILFYPQ